MNMTWITWLALALAVLSIGVFGLAAYGHSRWIASTQVLIEELEATRLPAPASRYDARELEGLPAPVQRYFRATLKDGQPIITAATIELRGSFNLSPTGERWKPFTSMQRAVTNRPGFVWDGHVALAPGIAVHVHDAYIAGVGILKPSVMGLYALADVHGAGEIARDELMRYFAEAAWYPTALLPSQGVRWEAVDDRSAKATLIDGALSVTMLVAFDSAGMIESSRFEARGGNKLGPTPWEGRWYDYQERNGMQLPMTGEAAWLPALGRKPYFRGTVTSLVHEVSP
jgi:hypothetical protein